MATDESGLLYMRSRYYSPALHQFLSADSYMGDLYHPLSLNLYSYVEGNPVRYIDPMGYWATEFATYDSGNERTRKDREVIRKFDEVLTYVNREKGKAYYALEYGVHSIEQVIGGNYSKQTTLLGTTGQVALSASGFDLPMDLRDLTYDIQHFECTKGHMMQTGIDAIGLLPLVGMLKHGDEVGTLVKNADEIADSVKKGVYQGGQAAEELMEQIDETVKLVKKGDHRPVKIDLQLFSEKSIITSVENMKEFFKSDFGKSIKNKVKKTKKQYQGQSIYEVTGKTSNKYLEKGYRIYLDALHKDHLEVIDGTGRVRWVLNLDGTLNQTKTELAKGRRMKGW